MKDRKLRILFDAQALVGNKSGVGYYSAGLISSLAKRDDVELIGHYYDFLGKQKPDLPTAPTIRYHCSKFLPYKLVNLLRRFRLEIPFELLVHRRGDFIIYPNFLSHPSLFRTPSAVVVYDFTYLEHPAFVSPRNCRDLSRFVPQSLRRASFALTISHVSARTLARFYPWFTSPIIVEHIPVEALPTKLSQPDKLLRALGINSSFLLFIGTLEPRKNISGLLKAYALLPKKLQQTYALVLAGGQGWNDETIRFDIAAAQTAGLNVIQTGYITDEQKGALYAGAELFVWPSWYEGYGMPLLEAASYQLPVVTSDLAIFKEILGQAAVFCDPADPASIADGITEALSSPALRKTVQAHQKQLMATLDWQQLAGRVVIAIKRSVPS